MAVAIALSLPTEELPARQERTYQSGDGNLDAGAGAQVLPSSRLANRRRMTSRRRVRVAGVGR